MSASSSRVGGLPDLDVGDRVTHRLWPELGEGVVTGVTAPSQATVRVRWDAALAGRTPGYWAGSLRPARGPVAEVLDRLARALEPDAAQHRPSCPVWLREAPLDACACDVRRTTYERAERAFLALGGRPR